LVAVLPDLARARSALARWASSRLDLFRENGATVMHFVRDGARLPAKGGVNTERMLVRQRPWQRCERFRRRAIQGAATIDGDEYFYN
jgi:hypothetical protein